MSDRAYKVIPSVKLSTENEVRYVVEDSETSELLDDAQGFGYKTIREAYAGYGYELKEED